MFCAISGSTPEDPVVAKTSGLLFERRLVEKYIEEHGKCPVTDEPLSKDDLLSLKTNKAVKPRPVSATSIPGLLSLFQNEWDAVMLETHQLRQQLDAVRQELSHALYQHDAACRVIARIHKENESLRAALAIAERAEPLANGKRAAEDEGAADAPAAKRAKAGITPEVIQEMTETSTTLSKARKKRQVSPTLATPEALDSHTQIASHPLHKTTAPGILSVDVHPTDSHMFVTGGVDTNAVVFNLDSGKIVATLAGHTKKVTATKFLPKAPLVLTCSGDKSSRLWRAAEDGASYDCVHVLRDHKAEVTGASIHATGNYFVTASIDKTWCFYDVESAACLSQVTDPGMTGGFSCATFHPDGLILGTGTTESLVRIWDVKSQANVAKFEGHTGTVTSLSFSENGYYLATAAADGVKLWDLRKLKNFRNIQATSVNVVEFDYSGLYLGVGGTDTRVYNVKQDWSVVKTFPDNSGTGKVTSVKFGPDAKFLAVASMDRNLRLFGASIPETTAEHTVST
eukprot:jgi/Chlat1/8788/Chrsp90S08134